MTIPSNQSFSIIQRRISLFARSCEASEERRAVEHNGKPTATVFRVFHLADHVLKEEKRAVVDTWQASAESTAKVLFVVLLADEVFFRLPFHPERRIRKHVVKFRPGEVILGKAVAEFQLVNPIP